MQLHFHTTTTRRTSERSIGTFQQGDPPPPSTKLSLTIAALHFIPLVLHISLSLLVFKNIDKINSFHNPAAPEHINAHQYSV
jgi:hypothetical protein